MVGMAALATIAVAVAFVMLTPQSNKVEQEKKTEDHSSMVMARTMGVDEKSDLYKTYKAFKGPEYDNQFITNALIHYHSITKMMELVEKYAERQEIKDFASNTKAVFSEQFGELKGLNQYMIARGLADVVGQEGGFAEEQRQAVFKLEQKRGEHFDKEFLEMMVLNLQDTLNMAATGGENAELEELKQLTKEIVTSNKEKTQQLHTWQMEWYGMSM